MEKFTLAPALKLETDGSTDVDVRVSFENGKPRGVSFFDSDRDAMITVPFDLWARVVAAVEKTVDMQSFDEPVNRFSNLIAVGEESDL